MFVLKILGVALVFAIAAILLVAATKPNTFTVQRKVVVHAKPGKITPYIEDFHAWKEWSPWEDMDPGMKKTFKGPDKGVGAVYGWEGNGKVGTGTMEITGVQDSSRVTVKLDFLKPFEAHNVAEFTLAPTGETTEVTWSMSGPNRFFAKVMQVFLNMDKMIGKDFEKGLGNLKTVAEK